MMRGPVGDGALQMKSGGERAEIIELYKDTSDELRRLLVRKLGNPQEAEEIAHDAYLKLCHIEHREDIRDLRKYLFTMSVRLALNVLRKRKTENKYLDYGQIGDSQNYGDERSAYRILLGELKLAAVKEALAELPEKTRYIFLLHRFEGLSYKKIARKLAISDKAVEYHMSRALEKVMLAVNEYRELDG